MPFLATIEGQFAFGKPQTQSNSNIVTQNLIIWVDANNNSSYGGTGTKWSNLVSAYSATNWMQLSNSPTYSNVALLGSSNKTLYFDGANDYATPNASLWTLANNASWNETREYWVYWPGAAGCLTMESGVASPDFGWYDAQASMSNTGLFYSVWQGSVAMTAYQVYNSLLSNSWNHIVWQHSKSSNLMMAYVNGVQTYSNAAVVRTTPPGGANQEFFPVLCAGSATNFGNGSASYLTTHLGVFRWYNTILSSNLVNTNYNTERSRFQPSSNLLLYLDAGNPSSYNGSGTTWTDLSSNGNNATSLTGVTYSSLNGGYLTFNGTTGSGTLDASKYNTSYSGKTIFVAGNLTSISSNSFRAMVGSGAGSRNFNFYMYNTASNTYQFHYSAGGTGSFSTDLSYTPGNWFTGAVTQATNGTTLYYLNGVQVSQTTQSFAQYSNSTEYVGRADNYWNGPLSVVAVYKAALTPAEILANHNAVKGRYGLA